MVEHEYTAGELSTAGTDIRSLRQKLLDESYTNPIVLHQVWVDDLYHVTVDGSDDKATVLTAMEDGTIPVLALTSYSVLVDGDGVDTGTTTISDSRGASADGKVVKVTIPQNAFCMIDADSYTLDSSGDAVITFGPLAGCTGEISISIGYESDEADPVMVIIRFGT